MRSTTHHRTLTTLAVASLVTVLAAGCGEAPADRRASELKDSTAEVVAGARALRRRPLGASFPGAALRRAALHRRVGAPVHRRARAAVEGRRRLEVPLVRGVRYRSGGRAGRDVAVPLRRSQVAPRDLAGPGQPDATGPSGSGDPSAGRRGRAPRRSVRASGKRSRRRGCPWPASSRPGRCRGRRRTVRRRRPHPTPRPCSPSGSHSTSPTNELKSLAGRWTRRPVAVSRTETSPSEPPIASLLPSGD